DRVEIVPINQFDRIYRGLCVYQTVSTFFGRIWCNILVAGINIDRDCAGAGSLGDGTDRLWKSGFADWCGAQLHECNRTDRCDGGLGHKSDKIFNLYSYYRYDNDDSGVVFLCGWYWAVGRIPQYIGERRY